MIPNDCLTTSCSALIIAHPGHEIRVHGWLELARPFVFVITDGSGHSGKSRLDSTTKVLKKVNAKQGNIYGRFSDKQVYAAILNRDFDLFIRLTEELVNILTQMKVELVIGDAVEGYNPSHDICRLIINAAVEILLKRGHKIDNFDFLLSGKPDSFPAPFSEQMICLPLNNDALVRKLATAQAYDEIAAEVNSAIEAFGIEAFRIECFRRVHVRGKNDCQMPGTPFYEQYGEKKVASGLFQQVLRYREHVYPLAETLWNYIKRLS
jgi:AcrR family transcriptional regulator